MNIRVVLRSAFLLLAVIVPFHGLLLFSRIPVSIRLQHSWGYIGIDTESRVRNFEEDLRVLPGDTVDESDGRASQVDLSNLILRRVSELRSRPADRGGRPLAKEPLFGGRKRNWGQILLSDGQHYSVFLERAPDLQWAIYLYKYESRLRAGVNKAPQLVATTPVPGLAARPRVRHAIQDQKSWSGFIDDEYFEIGIKGELLARVSVPVPVADAQYVRGMPNPGRIPNPGGFMWIRPSVRPDRVEATLVRIPENIERTIVLEPESAQQRFLHAWLTAIVALRPPLLNVAATLAVDAPILNYRLDSFLWWWLDPLLVEGANLLAVGIGMLVSLLCALFAFRAVRRRGLSTFWVAGVFLLGPIGLLWMRLSVPWVALENGRAVNIGEWPEPERNGTEVFA